MSADEEVAVENGSGAHCNGTQVKEVNGVKKGETEDESIDATTSNGDAPPKRANGSETNGVEGPPSKKVKQNEDNEEENGVEEEKGKEEEKKEEEGEDKGKSPVPDDPDIKIIEEKEENGRNTPNGKEKGAEKKKDEEKDKKKEPELINSEALLEKLDEYVKTALDKQENVERKVLDALLAAINIQVQKEPLSVRKLILDKQLVLPNTISFPPSSVVDLLIEHDPDHPLQKVIQKMFPDEKPKLSEAEKKERHLLKMHFGAPHMTKLLMDIGQDLVQESTYCDIVHARNLPEVPKNIETYKQVAAQLKPVWESLRKKNEPYKLKQLTCHICGFKTESRIVMIKHRSIPHFDGKKYQCTMCSEYDTNESRMASHYIEAHDVVPVKEDPPLRNPCYVCDEDFQLKGQREAHYKMCKRDYHRLRNIMSPKSPDDLCMINRWLWEKPPIDPTILQQQQVAQQQQLKQQRQTTSGTQGTTQRNSTPSRTIGGSSTVQQQQQLLAQQQQQRMRLLAAQQAAFAQSPSGRNQTNTLIAAMQQHLQKVAATGARGSQQTLISQMQRSLAQQKTTALAAQQQQQLMAAAKQMQQHNGHKPSTPSSRTSIAAPSTAGGLSCEICDQPQGDKEKYLGHLQSQHRQMKNKQISDMQQGAPLACSRCRDRFWTYEGLERHLVMSHGLVTSDLLHKAQKKEDGGRCKLCGKQYAFNMLQHLVADHQVKLCSAEIMYSCDVCSFKCQSYQKLEQHLSTNHPKNGTPKDVPSKGGESAECITLDD